uniref:Uncharacterized protein n=1 Tax=Romanomermis culicivorax TaxID=13658 RepID=A0A915HWL3_ROMCU
VIAFIKFPVVKNHFHQKYENTIVYIGDIFLCTFLLRHPQKMKMLKMTGKMPKPLEPAKKVESDDYNEEGSDSG